MKRSMWINPLFVLGMTCCSLPVSFAQSEVAVATPVMASFLNGGIGEEERDMLTEHAKEYNLKLTFAETSGAYLADVAIAIENAKREEVLNLDSVGPILLVKLPPGKYHIEANSNDKIQRQTVTVGKGQRSLTLRWP